MGLTGPGARMPTITGVNAESLSHHLLDDGLEGRNRGSVRQRQFGKGNLTRIQAPCHGACVMALGERELESNGGFFPKDLHVSSLLEALLGEIRIRPDRLSITVELGPVGLVVLEMHKLKG